MSSAENYEFSIRMNRLIAWARQLAVDHDSIVLYGYGTIGRLLAPILRPALVGIVDVAARPGQSCEGVEVVEPSRLSRFSAQCVVVSVLGREQEIIAALRNQYHWQAEIRCFDGGGVATPGGRYYQASDVSRLRRLERRFEGQRCVIVGNGPSLNECNLSLLANEYTFGVNGIFYKTREMGFRPTFYVVEDCHVVDDNLAEINSYDCEYKFFPAAYRDRIKYDNETYFFNYDTGFYDSRSPYHDMPRFSFDASDRVIGGQTVTYSNMQLACYLGFTEIILIGVDFSYAVPASTIVEGNTYISREKDPNHFHPNYFGRGKKWHDPKLDKVYANYRHAKEVLERRGVRVLNATKGGKLDLFPREDYEKLMRTGALVG